MKLNIDLEVGHTLWRLNNFLVQMEDLKIKIRSTIKKYLEINDTEEVELVTLWEGVKAVYIYIYKYIYIIICFI